MLRAVVATGLALAATSAEAAKTWSGGSGSSHAFVALMKRDKASGKTYVLLNKRPAHMSSAPNTIWFAGGGLEKNHLRDAQGRKVKDVDLADKDASYRANAADEVLEE